MRLITIIFVFIFSFSFSQSLDWSYVNTGSNATIAISSDDFPNITFNGSSIPDGALIGVFYEDNNGDYACGGYNTWDSSGTISVTAWGTESGLDNGFAIGESYTWFLQIDGEDFSTDSNGATMTTTPPFSDNYSLNGFGQLIAVNFIGNVQGCTNSIACNYDPSATIDDGSCNIPSGCDSCSFGNVIDGDSDNDGVCDDDEVLGCTDNAFVEYNSLATDDDGSCITCVNDTDGDSICDENEVLGCTDPTEINYDPLATEDDGTCGCLGGCTNPSAENYDPNACQDDGSCFFIVFGCTDTGALNYNSLATVDNGSCCYIAGCTNPLYNEYNPFACFDDGSCSILPGCMDNGGSDGIPACNYNSNANFDNGSCEYISCADDCGVPFGDNSSCNPIGCGDPQADNYDPSAAELVIDPQICEYFGCTDQNSFNFNSTANVNDGSCCYIDGCTDSNAWNYSFFACFDDGSCEYLYGCTDINYVEFNPNATFDDGSCFTLIIYGCTNPVAANYDEFATVDDDSCIPAVEIDLLEVCNPYCENDFGSVTFELNGGVPPYSFISNFNVSYCSELEGCGDLDCFSIEDQEFYIEEIVPGFHSITVIDDFGFSFEFSFSVLNAEELIPFIWEDGSGLSTFSNQDWSYQWYFNQELLFSEINNQIDPVYGSGLYSVEVMDENGCVGYYDYDFLSSNLDLVENNEIVLFPNPSSNIIFLNTPESKTSNFQILISDYLGRVHIKKSAIDFKNLEIDINHLETGLYYITIFENNVIEKKLNFIKTKNNNK